LQVLDWPNQSQWNEESFSTWNVDSQEAGLYKTYGGLTFVEVNEAGHMVPHDQGKNALALINTFTEGGF